MTRDDLLKKLKEIEFYGRKSRDREQHHVWADEALLEYINDTEVTKAFDSIQKWYA